MTIPLVTIYCLRDPRDQAVRYVGQTNHQKVRQAAHERNEYQGNWKKFEWGNELLSAGLKPMFEPLEECDFMEANDRERHWSNVMTEQGHKLLNRPVGAILRSDLISSADIGDYEQRLQSMRNEIMRMMIQFQAYVRKTFPGMEAMQKAIRDIDRARWAMEDLMEKKRAECEATVEP